MKKGSTCYLPQPHKVGLKVNCALRLDLVVASPQPHHNPLVFTTRSTRLSRQVGASSVDSTSAPANARAANKREFAPRPFASALFSQGCTLRVARGRAAATDGRGHPITRHYVLVRQSARHLKSDVTPIAPAHNRTLSDAPARPCPPPSVVALNGSRYQA